MFYFNNKMTEKVNVCSVLLNIEYTKLNILKINKMAKQTIIYNELPLIKFQTKYFVARKSKYI